MTYKEEIQKRRHQNLRLLLENFRTRSQFCEEVGLVTQQLSRFLTDAGVRKNIGPTLARRWETTLDKPLGWMDDDHSDIVNMPINAEKLAESILNLNTYLESHDISPSKIRKDVYRKMIEDVIVNTITMHTTSVLNIERMLIHSKLKGLTSPETNPEA